jgi:hypothetical protein
MLYMTPFVNEKGADERLLWPMPNSGQPRKTHGRRYTGGYINQ